MAPPEKFVILKNNESATKIKLKRLAASKTKKPVKIRPSEATVGSIELTDSDSEAEVSASGASESTSKNRLSSLYDEFLIENFNNGKLEEGMTMTNLGKYTNKTPSSIRNSSNLANQPLDPTTINKKKFLAGFFKFLRENPEKTIEVLKLQTPNNNIPTASTSKGNTAEVTKISGSKRNVEKKQNSDDDSSNDDSSDEDTEEITELSRSTRNVEKEKNSDDDSSNDGSSDEDTEEITKLSGSARNVEKEQNSNDDSSDEDALKGTKGKTRKMSKGKRNVEKKRRNDDDDEDQILKKNLEQNFILPPEYEEHDSRWTLKYHKSAPELVELLPHTGVYANARNVSLCMRAATDCNTLARYLLTEIFKKSALSTCSLTGRRAKDYEIYGVRPGLNKKARTVLMEFVKLYGRKMGWDTNEQSIQNNIRNKLRDMRLKQK